MTSRIVIALAMGATLVSVACIHTSPDPAKDAKEKVHGGGYELVLKSGPHYYGELLAVTDTAFVLLIGRRVAIAPRSTVVSAQFGWGVLATPNGVISYEDIATMRHRSRFPFGLTAAAMAGLLSASGQSSPDILGKTPP